MELPARDLRGTQRSPRSARGGPCGAGLGQGPARGHPHRWRQRAALGFFGDRLHRVSAVPLCIQSPDEVLAHSIAHSAVELLVVDRKGYERFDAVRERLDKRPRIVLTEGQAEDAIPWEELAESSAAVPEVEVLPEDESKILYTSGSSGLPKGVIQTHANIVANVEEVWDLISKRQPLRMFKSAPDYHSMGILNIYYPLVKGWILDLARSPDRVLSDIRLSEPEGFLTVPLILDKVYGNVRKEIDAGGVKGGLIQRSVAAKERLARGQAGLGDQALLGCHRPFNRRQNARPARHASRASSRAFDRRFGQGRSQGVGLLSRGARHHHVRGLWHDRVRAADCRQPSRRAQKRYGGKAVQAVKIVAEDGSEIGYTIQRRPNAGPAAIRSGSCGPAAPMSCVGICTTPNRPSRC